MYVRIMMDIYVAKQSVWLWSLTNTTLVQFKASARDMGCGQTAGFSICSPPTVRPVKA